MVVAVVADEEDGGGTTGVTGIILGDAGSGGITSDAGSGGNLISCNPIGGSGGSIDDAGSGEEEPTLNVVDRASGDEVITAVAAEVIVDAPVNAGIAALVVDAAGGEATAAVVVVAEVEAAVDVKDGDEVDRAGVEVDGLSDAAHAAFTSSADSLPCVESIKSSLISALVRRCNEARKQALLVFKNRNLCCRCHKNRSSNAYIFTPPPPLPLPPALLEKEVEDRPID